MRKRISITLITLAMLLLLTAGFAAAAEMNASTSGGTVETGQTVTMTLTLTSSDSIGAFRLCVKYDASILEYMPGDNDGTFCNGGNGTIFFVDTPMQTSASYTITFKAVNVGTTSFAISYDVGDVWSANDEEMTVKPANGSVTVKAPREASSDCNLASLIVGDGAISPAFSKDVTEYTVSVGADVAALTINALPSSEYAKVSIAGNSLVTGLNTVNIVVTAEDGTKKTYVIKATKAEPTPTLSPTDTPTPTETMTPTPGIKTKAKVFRLDADGKLVSGEEELQLAEILSAPMPEDFTKDRKIVLDADIEVYKQIAGDLVLVELSDGALYLYDEENQSFTPYKTMKNIVRNYRIGIAPEDRVPAGYTLFAYESEDVAYPAYRIDENSDFILVFVDGDTWYKYDVLEGTFQRYDETESKVVVVTATPTDTPEPTPTTEVVPTEETKPEESTEADDKENTDEPAPASEDESSEPVETHTKAQNIIRLAVTAFVFLLAILFMILYVREKNRRTVYEPGPEYTAEAAEPEYEDDDVPEGEYETDYADEAEDEELPVVELEGGELLIEDAEEDDFFEDDGLSDEGLTDDSMADEELTVEDYADENLPAEEDYGEEYTDDELSEKEAYERDYADGELAEDELNEEKNPASYFEICESDYDFTDEYDDEKRKAYEADIDGLSEDEDPFDM